MSGVCETHGPHSRKKCEQCRWDAMIARDFPERVVGPWQRKVKRAAAASRILGARGRGRLVVSTFTVICRSCASEQIVRVLERSASSPGEFLPDCCVRCGSDDLVALRDLTIAELEEIELAIAERAPSTRGETGRAPRDAVSRATTRRTAC